MQKIVIRLTSLVLLALIIGPFELVSANTNRMKDIPTNYATEINRLIEKEIITGYEDGQFKPNRLVTREESAAIIGRALQLEDVEPRETVFDDVNPKSFASGYIQRAFEENVIKGYDDGTFKPKNNMTRLEMAYLLSNAFNLTDTTDVFYVDMPTGKSQSEVIRKVTNAGITNGYTDGKYKPTQSITRLEFAIMVARAMYPEYKVEPIQYNQETQYVKVSNLSVRTGPNTNDPVAGTLQKYDEVVTYLYTEGWYYIGSDTVAGYVPQSKLAKSLEDIKQVIAIDPGHGGKDPGAVGNGYREKDIVLNVGLHLRDYLNNAGIQVVMTRSTDTFLSLDERIAVAVNGGADTFVSIHMNSSTSSSPKGTETYYSTAGSAERVQSSKKLTEFIQKRLLQQLGTTNRGEKTAAFRVIHKNSLPSVLVELGFISNAQEANLIANNEQEAAHAIYMGIVDYYNWLEN